jgi:glycosyltransferase involved in cell wall biosynthesis
MGIAEDSFVCICCSRAIEKKGWREAIEVVTRLRKEASRDVDLVLLGGGGLFEELSAKPLPSFVHLMGNKGNVLGYMAAADAMLFPTYFEGESVPLSIIEAMALGKPVISTRVGQIETMLGADTDKPAGIATALDSEGRPDIELLTKALGSLVIDSGLYERLAANTSSRFSQFDMGRCVERYLACFKEAAGQAAVEC